MNGADTAWMLTSTTLVLFMTLPGLALFYGGLVRARNALSVFTQIFSIACIISILWFAIGYSLAFDKSAYGVIGGISKMFLSGITTEVISGTIPELLFFAFQMTFAIITPALIVGAYVERINFTFVLAFSSIWMILCYAPVTHWVWGGGFLSNNGIFGAHGVIDFAGGIVVHETAGIAALVIVFFLGGRSVKNVTPHNPGMTMIGAAMLWVGWFGFNAGSQLSVDGGTAMVLIVTHISAASASISWSIYERIKHGKFSLVGLVTGTISGLASITPAASSVSPIEAMLIGAIAGIATQEMCSLIKSRLNIDDTLDVFAVHGLGGILGTAMVAILGYGTFTAQFGSIFIVGVFTVVITTVIIKGLLIVIPIRVSEEDESTGLDITSHGERAYDLTS